MTSVIFSAIFPIYFSWNLEQFSRFCPSFYPGKYKLSFHAPPHPESIHRLFFRSPFFPLFLLNSQSWHKTWWKSDGNLIISSSGMEIFKWAKCKFRKQSHLHWVNRSYPPWHSLSFFPFFQRNFFFFFCIVTSRSAFVIFTLHFQVRTQIDDQ